MSGVRNRLENSKSTVTADLEFLINKQALIKATQYESNLILISLSLKIEFSTELNDYRSERENLVIFWRLEPNQVNFISNQNYWYIFIRETIATKWKFIRKIGHFKIQSKL